MVCPAAAGVGFIAAVFALALPFLVEGSSAEKAFLRSLSAWSGGPVRVRGKLRLASFASLSIVAEDVSFAATPRLAPIRRIDAKSITAVLRLRALLRGQLEFKRVVADSPQFVFSRRASPAQPVLAGFETASGAAAFAGLSRFENLELRNATFFVPQGERRPYWRFSAERIQLQKPVSAFSALLDVSLSNMNGSPVSLSMQDNGFEVHFSGSLGRADVTAQGSLTFKAPAGHPAASKITALIAPWEQGRGVSLAGDLKWSGSWASLDGATISFDGRNAKGSLTVASRRGRRLLEGTLAYDKLEWTQTEPGTGADGGADAGPLRVLAFAGPGRERSIDLDMRISAEHFQAGPYEAGPLALALSARQDRFSIDIAELTLFGGTVTGRIDYDSAHPGSLFLNAAGARLNSRALTDALGWPFSVSGPVSVNLVLEIPFKGNPAAGDIKAATGSFDIDFPAGGTLEGDVSRHFSAALSQREILWGLGSSSLAFTAASIEGSAGPGGIAVKIDGETAIGRIGGSLRIASPNNTVSGTLSLTGAPETAASPEGALLESAAGG